MKSLRPALFALASVLVPALLPGGAMKMQIASAAFSEGGPIPKRHTCEGADVSPPLSWSNAPAQTRELALICEDPDAPGGTFVHWVAWGIAPGERSLPEGLPRHAGAAPLPGVRQGRNDFGADGYRGPCPPPGRPHRYFFRLYALDAAVAPPPGASAAQLRAAIAGHVLAEAETMGRFGR